ncbi:MAG: cytochrome c biogenesis heme-transporting ATPase CcmA [bacterium]
MSLSIKNLECVRGDRRLFSELDFELAAGQLLYLKGHNGSGKTTLMRALCGLLLPTEGEISWQGKNIRELDDEYRRSVLYIGHKNGIKDDLTGIENLQFSCKLDGVDISEQQAWDALEKIGLRGHEDLPARVLSQGQRRRVCLARLLVNKAPLWILDEPFTALDVAAVALLQSLIREHLEAGGTVVLTTHQSVDLLEEHSQTLQLGWKAEGDV